MSAIDAKPFPRGALIGAGVMIGTVLVAVGAHQIIKFNTPAPAAEAVDPSDIVAERTLRFVDVQGGTMAVDASTGTELGMLGGTDGFIETVRRVMAFERDKHGVQPTTGFRLVQWRDGTYTLTDPAVGTHVRVDAFGKDNLAAFTQFLPAEVE